MNSAMRIAVLSDLHIDRATEPDSWGLAKTAFRAACQADHVVIAGDVFDCASSMERDRDKVRRFLQKLDLWDPDRLSIVPGNHDVFHTPHHGSWLEHAAESTLAVSRDANESYTEFCDWAGDLIPDGARYWSDDPFPFVKDLGGVSLIGADTSTRTANHVLPLITSRR